MDISELQLKINKNKAVNDLKSVESQLEKTGNAADGLISTLKDIGLTVGFGKLVKDSLQLNNTFKALDGKFKSIFSGGFDTKVFSELKSELTLSDSALKNILSTTGQFAKGLGQSSQYVKNFSTDLTRAAADYAAYQGKTSAADVNEYARKFAKATLGEVGELKDIGIIIDTTSKQFQNTVKEMAELTGTTEAQAKQMVIQKELLEQVKIASGSASKNMYDGWAQLNKLFDQFKEILADVGGIFSKSFGPILKVFNSIIEIPFVKSTTAWAIAIGSIAVGYAALMKVLFKINSTIKDALISSTRQRDVNLTLLSVSKSWGKEIEKVRKTYDHIFETASKIPGVKIPGGKKSFFKLNANEKDLFKEELGKIPNSKLLDELNHAQDGFDKLKGILTDMGITSKDVAASGLEDLNDNMLQFISTLEIAEAKTLLQVAAEKALIAARAVKSGVETTGKAISGGVDAVTTGSAGIIIWNAIKKSFSTVKEWFGKAAHGLWVGLKAVGSSIAWAFKFIIAPISKVAGLLLAVAGAFIVPFDLVIKAVSKFSGQDFSNLEIIPKIANLFANIPDMEKIDRDLKTKLAISKQNKQLFEQLFKEATAPLTDNSTMEGLKKEQMKAIKDLNDVKRKMQEMQKQFTLNANITNEKDRKANLEKLKTEFQQLGEAYKQHQQTLADVQDKIKQKQQELVDLNWKYFDELDKLQDEFLRLREGFSYGYKDGKFKDNSKEIKYNEDIGRIGELYHDLKKLGNATDVTSLERARKYQTEIFRLTKEKYKYEVDELLNQRQTMLENLKAMNDVVKDATRYRSTAQSAIEANSMEALQLTSRRMDGLNKSELSPIVEQQKQVKDIERQVLAKQNQAVTTLEKINNQIYKVVQKIGTSSGADIKAINPL